MKKKFTTEEKRLRANEANKRWRAKNKEKISAYSKEYREANPEKYRIAGKKWRESNPAKVKSAHKEWALANPEKVLINGRKSAANYYKNNKEGHTKAQLKWKAKNPTYAHDYYMRTKDAKKGSK